MLTTLAFLLTRGGSLIFKEYRLFPGSRLAGWFPLAFPTDSWEAELLLFPNLFILRLYWRRRRALVGPGLTAETYLKARVCHLPPQTERSFIHATERRFTEI